MNKLLVAFSAVGLLAADTAFASVYTVSPGEILQITDAIAGDYADGLAFADETGVVEFDTSSAPTMVISGAGTVRKVTAAAWTMSTPIPDFTGVYDLEAGVTSFSAAKVFGADGSSAQILYVRDGATLSFVKYATSKLNYRTIHAAGRGVDGRGALEMVDTASDTSYGQFRNLVLEDDTLINFPNGGLVFIGGSDGIDLNGHDLHLAGKGTFTYLNKLKGDGEIVLEGASGMTPTWVVRAGTFDPDAQQAFRMSGYSKISVTENTTRKPNVPIYVTGVGNTLAYSEYWNKTWEWNTNGVGWAGAITFVNEPGTAAKLTLSSEGEYAYYKQFTLTGPITGPGQVAVELYHKHRVCFAATNNTFSGGLYVGGYHGANSGQFCALHPGSLPAYSSITGEYGHVDATFLPDADNPWTADEFAKLAAQATWQQNAFALMDVSAYTNGVPPSAPLSSNVTVRAAIGANGAVDLTGTTAQGFPDYFDWNYGHAVLSGPQRFEVDTFRIENGSLASVYPDGSGVTNSATVTLDGGIEIVTGTNMVKVGNNAQNTTRDATARLVVKDAFLHTSSTNRFWSTGRSEALAVGCGDGTWSPVAGILEVRDGGVVSNKLHVAGGGVKAGEGGGRGLMIQKGGTVYALGATKDTHFGSAVGMAGHGAYDMRGGTFTAFGSFMVGAYCAGVWRQSGGDVSWTNYPDSTAKAFGFGYANGGWGTLDMTGGRFRVASGELGLAQGYTAGSQRAMLSIRGPGTYFGGAGSVWRVGGNSNCNTSTVVVANGAVVQVGGVINGATKQSDFVFAFDGGTLRTGLDDACLFGCESSYSPPYKNFKPENVPTAVLVYAGGMTLDTDGFTGGYSSFPITMPRGGGVTGTAFAEELTGGTFATIPQVVMEGDGHGACAVAQYDAERGAVTGIEVTCPGEGYTWARAGVCYQRGASGNGGTVTWYDCTIGANAQTGGFTKAGAGDFTLKATNDWAGVTTAAGGVLKADVDYAIPTNAAVRLAGGDLDLNGKAACITGVVYAAGGGRILNAGAATLPDAFSLETTVDDIVAGKAIALTGDVDLEGVPLTVFGDDFSALDPKKKGGYPVVTATGTLTGAPALTSEPLPANWAFRPRGNKISLVYLKGTMLIVR